MIDLVVLELSSFPFDDDGGDHDDDGGDDGDFDNYFFLDWTPFFSCCYPFSHADKFLT